MLGHIPLPAKITIQVLEPIDVSGMDVDEAYELVTGEMQRTLTGMNEERGLPVIG
jgi:methylaspartate ammonia-lyase